MVIAEALWEDIFASFSENRNIRYKAKTKPLFTRTILATDKECFSSKTVVLGPVARSLVSANRWLRGIKIYRFPWYLTLVKTNHASSNPGLLYNL